MVARTCKTGDLQTTERRDFINAIAADAKRFAPAVRWHWGVENRIHWRLDGVFNEDASRSRTGHAAAIMPSLRHRCINRFEQEPSSMGHAKKRRKAGWNDDYRAKVLFGNQFMRARPGTSSAPCRGPAYTSLPRYLYYLPG